jgi:hexosaminidase
MNLSGKVLSNDGLHGMAEKSMDIALSKGLHPVEIKFFQAGGGDGLKLEWKTAGRKRAIIGKSELLHH